MNLICPNCQRMLTVGDQYAGQLMKCPLCNGTFTAPSLPPTGPPAADSVNPPPPLSAAHEVEEAPVPLETEPETRPEQAAAKPPTGYAHTVTLQLSPSILPWIAPAGWLAIFILLFFPWVGLYPSGAGVYTQSGWSTIWGDFSIDPVWEKKVPLPVWANKTAILDSAEKAGHFDSQDPQYRPGPSGFMILFLLLLLFVALPLAGFAVAAVVLSRMQMQFPPVLKTLVPWRSLMLGGVIFLMLLCLALQLLWGFPLANMVKDLAHKEFAEERDKAETPEDIQIVDLKRAEYLAMFNVRTLFWCRLAMLVHVVAIAGSGLDYWLERRGKRAPPRADFCW